MANGECDISITSVPTDYFHLSLHVLEIFFRGCVEAVKP